MIQMEIQMVEVVEQVLVHEIQMEVLDETTDQMQAHEMIKI